jgi:hypothetical protein
MLKRLTALLAALFIVLPAYPADIPSDFGSWSSTAGSNQPQGTTNIGTGLDDNLRAIQAAVKALMEPLSAVAGTNTVTATMANLTAYYTGLQVTFSRRTRTPAPLRSISRASAPRASSSTAPRSPATSSRRTRRSASTTTGRSSTSSQERTAAMERPSARSGTALQRLCRTDTCCAMARLLAARPTRTSSPSSGRPGEPATARRRSICRASRARSRSVLAAPLRPRSRIPWAAQAERRRTR